jgi:REP element-mobilizing transposase RayT
MKSEDQFIVYGYCLMTNHIHLLIKENTDMISRVLSRIGTSYAWKMKLRIERPTKKLKQ